MKTIRKSYSIIILLGSLILINFLSLDTQSETKIVIPYVEDRDLMGKGSKIITDPKLKHLFVVSPTMGMKVLPLQFKVELNNEQIHLDINNIQHHNNIEEYLKVGIRDMSLQVLQTCLNDKAFLERVSNHKLIPNVADKYRVTLLTDMMREVGAERPEEFISVCNDVFAVVGDELTDSQIKASRIHTILLSMVTRYSEGAVIPYIKYSSDNLPIIVGNLSGLALLKNRSLTAFSKELRNHVGTFVLGHYLFPCCIIKQP